MTYDEIDDFDGLSDKDREFLEPGTPDLFDDPELLDDATFLWLFEEDDTPEEDDPCDD